jgi:hypothetical protein
LLLSAIPALSTSAAGVWIDTDPARPAPGQPVVVHLFSGETFPGSEVPYRAGEAGRFQRLWRSGRADIEGVDGRTPAGRFIGEEPGVTLIAFDSADDRSFGKALVVVGSPEAGDPLRWSEIGQRLEIVPQSDPVELARRPGAIELQLLYEREPLAGASVTAVSAIDPADVRTDRTDEIGMARLELDRPGAWLIRADHGEQAGKPLHATLHLVVGGAERSAR